MIVTGTTTRLAYWNTVFSLWFGLACVSSLAAEWQVEQIIADCKFTEGPVWLAREGRLLFSDVQADVLYAWSPDEGRVVVRQPSLGGNGNTLDHEGRLITCRHAARDVVRQEADGLLTVLCASHDGGLLNSPNDVVVQSNGAVWFTDPPYGLGKRPKEQSNHAVYRLDPGTREPVAVITDLSYPNGLAFSPDEHFLYVAESDHHIVPNFIMRYRLTADGCLGEGQRFHEVEFGAADGLRVDRQGRVYCTSGAGVEIVAPDGRLLEIVRTPDPASNCALGDSDGRTLYITARTAVYRATAPCVPGL